MFTICFLQAAGDRTEGPGARSVIDALIDLEQQSPGSCEAFVGRLLHRLGRSSLVPIIYFHLIPFILENQTQASWCPFSCKEPSVKGLQEVATRAFTRSSQAALDAAESKKKSSTQLVDNPKLSPLARFLLSRSVCSSYNLTTLFCARLVSTWYTLKLQLK